MNEGLEARASRLFDVWNSQPTRQRSDKYVTVSDFRDALADYPDCTDEQITEIVDSRAHADLVADYGD